MRMGGKQKQAFRAEGNVIWGGSLINDSSVIYGLLVLSTFVTCDEILGCLVMFYYLHSIFLEVISRFKVWTVLAWELITAQSCPSR